MASIEEVRAELKQDRIKDWERLFKTVTDPDVIEDNLRKAKTLGRQEDKRKDTGL